MSDHEAKSHYVKNGKAVQSKTPQQSAWLTHWAGTRFESSTHDHSTYDHDVKKHINGVEAASDNFGSSKGIKDLDLTMSLKKPGTQSFPFLRRGQEHARNSILHEKTPQISHKKSTTDLNLETSSRERHFQPEIVSQIPTEQVKYHMFFGESSFSSLKPSKEKSVASSHINTTHGPENFRQLIPTFTSKDHSPKVHYPKHENSEIPSFLRQKNTSILKTDPSTSSNNSPPFIENQYKRMQEHIGIGFPEMTKSTFQNVPNFVHDMEMTRMCGPLEGLTTGIHSFSRTTHSLLITKQTDVKVYQDNQIFRESRVSTQFKGEAFRELNCSPPHFVHGQQGVKLQLLESDHESQENVEDLNAAGDFQKNESSADTDAMDMESFKKNQLSGSRLFPQNKETKAESNLPVLPPITSSKEKEKEKENRKKRKIEIPDMNLEVSALQAASSSSEKLESSHSRTQSLDMNTLIENNTNKNKNNDNNSKSDECSGSNIHSDFGNRWIKRLKLTHSDSKSPESSSHEKPNKLSESSNPISENITLSHSWIQRWSHSQNQKIPEVRTPESAKNETDEFPKKQFPSIAAMALMGKAMSGYQQCKFKKKESFVIWNTKTFE